MRYREKISAFSALVDKRRIVPVLDRSNVKICINTVGVETLVTESNKLNCGSPLCCWKLTQVRRHVRVLLLMFVIVCRITQCCIRLVHMTSVLPSLYRNSCIFKHRPSQRYRLDSLTSIWTYYNSTCHASFKCSTMRGAKAAGSKRGKAPMVWKKNACCVKNRNTALAGISCGFGSTWGLCHEWCTMVVNEVRLMWCRLSPASRIINIKHKPHG